MTISKIRGIVFVLTPIVFPITILGQPPQLVPVYFWPGWNLCQNQAWNLVFHDEFNGNNLNQDNWSTYFPYSSDGTDQCEPCRAGDHNAIYRDENVYVDNGNLILRTDYEPSNWYSTSAEFSGGVIYSKIPWRFRRGAFEIRCKLPDTYGAPMYWPAFWLYGSSPIDPPGAATEIDGFEFCGNELSLIKTSRHRYYNGIRYGETEGHSLGFNASDGFHRYKIVWDYYFVNFYVDDILIRTTSGILTVGALDPVYDCSPASGTYLWHPLHPNQDAFLPLIVNATMSHNGGFCADFADNDHLSFPHDLIVDWIRVWQRTDNQNLPNLYSSPNFSIVGSTLMCQGNSYSIQGNGPCGDIVWQLGPGLTLETSDGINISVTPEPGFSGESSVTAIVEDSPFSSGTIQYHHEVWIGVPDIYVSQATVSACGNEATIVCHVNPDDGSAEHLFYWNNSQITSQTYNGTTYPVEPWHTQVTVPTGFVDFCTPWEVRSSNGCGLSSEGGVLRDNCIIGPCDIITLLEEDLVAYFNIYPRPITSGQIFHVSISQSMPTEYVDYVKISNQMGIDHYNNQNIQSNILDISTQGWPPGLYNILISLNQQRIIMEYQIKI